MMGIIIRMRQVKNLRKELDEGLTLRKLLKGICAAQLFGSQISLTSKPSESVCRVSTHPSVQ